MEESATGTNQSRKVCDQVVPQPPRPEDERLSAPALLEMPVTNAEGAPASDLRTEHAPAQRQEAQAAVYINRRVIQRILFTDRVSGAAR